MTFDGERAWVFLLAAGVTSLLFINFCDLVFDCGCRSYWNGAAELCNIHHAGPPHCPWCLYGIWGGGLSYAAILGAQGLVSFCTRNMSVAVRAGLALLLFPAIGAVTAGISGWLTGYWA